MHHALRELAWSLLDSGFRELRDAEKAGERTPRDHTYIRLYDCAPPICVLRGGPPTTIRNMCPCLHG